jgi:cell division protein FtsB
MLVGAMADAPRSEPRRNPRRSSRPKTTTPARPKPPRRARRRPAVRLALFLVVLVGLLFAFVYPTRTFLDQRDETNKARAQLELLRAENARLARESKRLSTDSEIERLAREKYGLVKPGERSYVILPAPSSTLPPPSSTIAPAP